MGIWIRSQNEMEFLEADKFGISFDKNDVNGVYYVCAFDDAYDPIKLGEYSSKEKALKVLDDICSVICRRNYIKFNQVFALNVFDPSEEKTMFAALNIFVMPKDDEVILDEQKESDTNYNKYAEAVDFIINSCQPRDINDADKVEECIADFQELVEKMYSNAGSDK